jgi:hypothetical protein
VSEAGWKKPNQASVWPSDCSHRHHCPHKISRGINRVIQMKRPYVHPKWNPTPYTVHYLWPEPTMGPGQQQCTIQGICAIWDLIPSSSSTRGNHLLWRATWTGGVNWCNNMQRCHITALLHQPIWNMVWYTMTAQQYVDLEVSRAVSTQQLIVK